MNPLNHVAIIMDGNGRWGLKNKNSRNAGHKKGLDTVEKIIKESIKQNIKYLTLFTFSTENWKRPKKEITYLLNLLENFLINKIENLHKQNIKLKISEKNLKKYLQTQNIPDPEILIRTGNTKRLSNFLLWQLAYTEIFFEKKLWPEFNRKDFFKIIKNYKKIKRNFGNI
jgi:undecaprenyl diphosphate synthase